MQNKTREYIKNEVEKLKQLKAKASQNMTAARLKTLKGFEQLSDEIAEEVLEQLREYAQIVLLYLNYKESKKGRNDE